MFSNPKVTFTPPPLPLLSAYLSPPFTLCISHFLFFSPPLTLCKPKVTGFMGCMHDVGKCQVVDFFPFHSPLSPLLCFLSFACLCGWGFGHICSYKFQPTNMTSLLCVAEALDLEALVLIVGNRSIEHQNAQTRKIFSCLLWRRDFFGTVNKSEALQLGIASYLFATGIISVWTGLEGKKPNRTKINRLEPIFGSVQKLKKKSVWFFILFQNRTTRKCSALVFICNF
jgi:hypothetical protein